MALVVKEWDGLSESQATSDSKTARRVFKVKDDAGALVSPVAAEIAVAATVPYASSHPDDPTRVCNGHQARPLDSISNEYRLVDVTYTSFSIYIIANPLELPDRWTIDTLETEEEY